MPTGQRSRHKQEVNQVVGQIDPLGTKEPASDDSRGFKLESRAMADGCEAERSEVDARGAKQQGAITYQNKTPEAFRVQGSICQG